ncbi:MAG: cytochrome c [Myxococcales bacterium]|nr:cytochrome c [Myxococcales bacterium]
MIRSAVVALFLVGCSGETEPADNRAADILALTGDVTAGQTGYETYCDLCHGAMGEGVEGSGSNIQGVGASNTVGVVLNPPEGMSDYSILMDQEIADIAAYVETL